MIRVNLLVDARASHMPMAARVAPAALGTASLAIFVVWWIATTSQDRAVIRAIGVTQAAIARQGDVRAEVDRLSRERADLSARIEFQGRLRAAQRAPAVWLRAVGRSMTDRVWLTAVTQEGVNVQIEGRALTVAAALGCARALEAADVVGQPVETLARIADAGSPDIVQFVIRGRLGGSVALDLASSSSAGAPR